MLTNRNGHVNGQTVRRRSKPRKPEPYTNELDPDDELFEPFSTTQDMGDPFPPVSLTDLPADVVIARLRALRLRVIGAGPWQAICPAHPDTKPSLCLQETAEGVLLMCCFGGCDNGAVLAKLGLNSRVYYPSLYALQFSKRRPRGPASFHGGGHSGAVAEPTDQECAKWDRLLRERPIPRFALHQLATHLDLPRRSLLALSVGYNPDENCWIFPERDDRGRVVGLVRRYPDGSKRAIVTSVRGLTIPRYDKEPPPGPVHLVEGASDTAALVSVGAFVVGRFSAAGSAAERRWLARLLAKYPDRDILVVGEREKSGAGRRGASGLAAFLHEELKRPVGWALPLRGYKDSREQVVAGEWNRGLRIQGELK